MNEDFQKFSTYLAASDALIEQATKEEVAEVARVLAFHVAHYRQRYCDVSIKESLEMLRTEMISDEMAKTLAVGLDRDSGLAGVSDFSRLELESIS